MTRTADPPSLSQADVDGMVETALLISANTLLGRLRWQGDLQPDEKLSPESWRQVSIMVLKAAEKHYVQACKDKFAAAEDAEKDRLWWDWWKVESRYHRGDPRYKGRNNFGARPEEYEGEPHPSCLSNV